MAPAPRFGCRCTVGCVDRGQREAATQQPHPADTAVRPKIVTLLEVRFSPTALPTYRGGAADAERWAARSVPTLCDMNRRKEETFDAQFTSILTLWSRPAAGRMW